MKIKILAYTLEQWFLSIGLVLSAFCLLVGVPLIVKYAKHISLWHVIQMSWVLYLLTIVSVIFMSLGPVKEDITASRQTNMLGPFLYALIAFGMSYYAFGDRCERGMITGAQFTSSCIIFYFLTFLGTLIIVNSGEVRRRIRKKLLE